MSLDDQLDEGAADFRNIQEEIRASSPVSAPTPVAAPTMAKKSVSKTTVFVAIIVLVVFLIGVYLFLQRATAPAVKAPLPGPMPNTPAVQR